MDDAPLDTDVNPLVAAAVAAMTEADAIDNIEERARAHGGQAIMAFEVALGSHSLVQPAQAGTQSMAPAESTTQAPAPSATEPVFGVAGAAPFGPVVPPTLASAHVAAGATSPMAAESTAQAPAPSAEDPVFGAADAPPFSFGSAVPTPAPNTPVAAGATPMQVESTAPAHPLSSSTVGAAAEPQAAPEAAPDVADAPAVATVVEPFDPASLDPNDENYLEKLRAECKLRGIPITCKGQNCSRSNLLLKLTRPPPAPPPPRNWTCADCGKPESECGKQEVLTGGEVVYRQSLKTDEGLICQRCYDRRRKSLPKLKNLPPLKNCLSCAVALNNYRRDGPYGPMTSCMSCHQRAKMGLPPVPPRDAWFCTNCGRNYDEIRNISDGPDGKATLCGDCRRACDHGPETFEARRNKQRVVTPEMHLALQNAIHEREFELAKLRADYSSSSQEDADAALALADAEAADNERLARFGLDEDVARTLRAAKKKQGEDSDLEGAAEPQTEIDHFQFRNVVEQDFLLKQIADSDVAKLPKTIISRLDFRNPKSSLFDKWVCPICLDRDCKEPQRVSVEGLLIPICEKCASATAH